MTTTLSSPTPNMKSAAIDEVISDSYPAGPHRHRVWLWLVVVAVLVSAVAAAAWAINNWRDNAAEIAGVQRHLVAPRTFKVVLKEKGELKATKSTDIKSEVEGRSTIISLIEEGTPVEEGDLLVELASDQIEDRIRQEELKETNAITAFEAAKTELDIQRDRNASDIRKAELEIELKNLELEKYVKGEWEQAKKDAQIAIDEAEITLQREEEDFEAAKELIERGFITRTDYEHDEFSYTKAQWDLAKAKMAKEVLETYTHVAELRKRQSDLEEAVKECDRVKKNAAAEETKKIRAVEGKGKELALIQDQLAKLRTQKEKCRITAPTPGFVVYYSESWRWGSNDQIKEGAEVRERQILMQLPDTSSMMAVVRVHEAKTSKLRIGQSAVVEVEGVPDKRFTGTVTKIAAVADTQNRWLNPDLKEYETEITLDPFDVPLKPGGTAHLELLVDTVEDRLAVPVQSVYYKTGRRYVFRQNGRDTEYIEVQVGAIGNEWTEITGGLAEGDEILLAFSDEETRMIPDLPQPARRGMPPGGRPAVGEGRKAGVPEPKADSAGKSRPNGKRTISQRRPQSSRNASANTSKKP